MSLPKLQACEAKFCVLRQALFISMKENTQVVFSAPGFGENSPFFS